MMHEIICEQARDAMLEAKLDELRGIGDSAVAMHVQSCAECARYAERILASYGKLNSGLAAISPAVRDNDIVPIRRRRPLRWLPLPLAAAAVIALLMVPRQNESLPNVDALAQLILEESPIVAPRAGEQALVMEKNEMTIVWLYKQETP
jgi:hypothetical protein